MAPQGQDHPDDTRPYLCIPYWSTPLSPGGRWDTGEDRPLPGAVVSYACPSIRTGLYTPGQPLDVTVDVRNAGGGNGSSIATVVVYWADPTVGFANPKFFAASSVAVSPGRIAPSTATTPTMTGTIPSGAPAHVCLAVVVSHPQDRAGTACDPFHDRHWAQRNLQAVAAGNGKPIIITLIAANPFDDERSYAFQVGPVDERHRDVVASEFHTNASARPARLRLLDADGAELSDLGERTGTQVDLGPYEERQLQVLVEMDGDVLEGQSVGFEAQLLDTRADDGPVGALGFAVLAPDRD